MHPTGTVIGVIRSQLHRRFVVRAAVVVPILLLGAPGIMSTTSNAASTQDRASPETIEARRHFFGGENVDPDTGSVRKDRVILSWFSVSSLAASFDGHVVLLDTYIHKREDQPAYVPTTLDELIALDPEAIFIGHGHFDHADTAGAIAVETGATVVGTPEHCDQVQVQADSHAGRDVTVDCVAAVSRGSQPGSEVNDLDLLGRGVEITAFKHLHSAAEPPDPEHELNPVLPLPDPGNLLVHPPGPGAFAHDPSGDEGFSMLYQFRVDDFDFTWHDTSGPLKENHPEVFDRMRELPSTDVQAGAILGFNILTNGLRDPAMYVQALDPKIFVPLHHDFISEYGSADDYEAPMRSELEAFGVQPELRWLSDPYDYLRPSLLTFDVDAPYWSSDG